MSQSNPAHFLGEPKNGKSCSTNLSLWVKWVGTPTLKTRKSEDICFLFEQYKLLHQGTQNQLLCVKEFRGHELSSLCLCERM